MRLIWSFHRGELALLEDAPLAGDSDYGIKPPVYLAVENCRASAAIPGVIVSKARGKARCAGRSGTSWSGRGVIGTPEKKHRKEHNHGI